MGRGGAIRFLGTVLVLALLAARPAQAAEAGLLDVLPKIDFTRGLRFMPSSQVDQAMGLLPKGELADDDVNWPIALGQGLASSAVNVGGVALFNYLSQAPAGSNHIVIRNRLIGFGVAQFALQPLVSATAVYLVGEADELHDVSFGWPLLVNYAAELVLVGLKVGIDLGAVPGTDAAGAVADVMSKWAAADYVLHALIPPVATTYFSVRSRGPKSISFSKLDQVLPATRSFADVREQLMQAAAPPLAAELPLAFSRF